MPPSPPPPLPVEEGSVRLKIKYPYALDWTNTTFINNFKLDIADYTVLSVENISIVDFVNPLVVEGQVVGALPPGDGWMTFYLLTGGDPADWANRFCWGRASGEHERLGLSKLPCRCGRAVEQRVLHVQQRHQRL